MAHPDDDAYGVAALVALHRTIRTSGSSWCTPPTARAARSRRAAAPPRRPWAPSVARRTAKPGGAGPSPYRHEWFGYPDGGLPDVPLDELVDRIADDPRRRNGPDVVATFGPDGITGHPDHIRIGEAATEAFLRFAGDGGPGFRRLVYGGIRQSVIDRWNRRRVRPA